VNRDQLIEELGKRGLPASAGHLKILRTLGRGGNGVAFRCSRDAGDDIVAKVYIPPDARELDDQSLERFQNEVTVASRIRHPYIIPAIDSGTARIGVYDLPFYVMPEAASTLRAIIAPPRGADDIQRISRLFLQVCIGVSGLHARGIVHRDLKPENLLISKEGTAWVADLGIAHIDPNFVSVSLRTRCGAFAQPRLLCAGATL
jgi:serine/threonine protein kinase